MRAKTLWFFFTVFVLYGCTIPFNFTTDTGLVARKLAHVPLSPFISADTGRRVSIPDAVQNILLYLPFGVLGLLAARPGTRGRLGRVVLVTCAGAALSVTCEAAQLFTLDRTTSVSDVAANTIGAGLGSLAAHLGRRAARGMLRQVAQTRAMDGAAFYPMLVMGVLVCVSEWEPFDATLDVGSVLSKLRTFFRDPWQGGGPADQGIAAIQFALFAAALAAWLDEVAIAGPVVTSAMVGAGAAVALEASQIVISSRMPGVEDVLVRAAGAMLGAFLWRLGRRSTSLRPWLALVIGATAAAVAVQMLSPFEIAPAFQHIQWVPFLNYYVHTSFETVSHVMELLLIYFPIGFGVVLASRRQGRAAAAALAIAFVIAAPVEAVQGWIVGRYADTTDVAFSVAGAWIGAWAARTGQLAFRERVAALTREGLQEAD